MVSFFEQYDPLHQTVVSYHITKAIAEIASSVLRNSLGAAAQSPLDMSAASSLQGNENPGVLGSLFDLAVSDSGTGDAPELSLESNHPLNTGFLEMADWFLPMDYQPELWQFEYLEAEDPDLC